VREGKIHLQNRPSPSLHQSEKKEEGVWLIREKKGFSRDEESGAEERVNTDKGGVLRAIYKPGKHG